MEVGGLELSLVGWMYMVKSNVRSAARFFSRPFQVLHRLGLLDPHPTILPLETGIHTLGDADLPYGVPPHCPRIDEQLYLTKLADDLWFEDPLCQIM